MPTVDEYLSEVYRVIRENFPSTDPTGGMTAAAAGYLVKLFVAPDQTQFGFLKFKDVLQQLEQQGLIRTGANSKDALSIWLIEQTGQPAPGEHEATYRSVISSVAQSGLARIYCSEASRSPLFQSSHRRS